MTVKSDKGLAVTEAIDRGLEVLIVVCASQFLFIRDIEWYATDS